MSAVTEKEPPRHPWAEDERDGLQHEELAAEQDRPEQDGREEREGEGLAEHLGEVLHEQVQDDHIDDDVNDRRRSVWL